jgi:hypothetical protein
MPDELIQRRQLLRGAGIAAGGAAVAGLGAVAAPAAADDDDHRHGHARLAGSWLVDVANDDGSMTVSVGSFAEGGVCVIHDIQPAGPPFTGSWKMRDKRRWRATVLSGFAGEGPGSPGPTIELRLRGELGRREISGSFTFTVTAPDGTDIATGSGTFSGRRIEA